MPTLFAMRLLTVASVLLLLLVRASAQSPEAAGPNLLRLEGVDPTYGIHYRKLILLVPDAASEATPNSDAARDPATLPRFTMECREEAGRISLHWLVRFTGSPDFSFQLPRRSTREHPYPPPRPKAQLRMRFEGYKKSQEFKREWEQQPNGELLYRNAGMHPPNMEDASYFLTWLTALPSLRIRYTNPPAGTPAELLISTEPLLELARKEHFCQP